jgi:hypothetical protein
MQGSALRSAAKLKSAAKEYSVLQSAHRILESNYRELRDTHIELRKEEYILLQKEKKLRRRIRKRAKNETRLRNKVRRLQRISDARLHREEGEHEDEHECHPRSPGVVLCDACHLADVDQEAEDELSEERHEKEARSATRHERRAYKELQKAHKLLQQSMHDEYTLKGDHGNIT